MNNSESIFDITGAKDILFNTSDNRKYYTTRNLISKHSTVWKSIIDMSSDNPVTISINCDSKILYKILEYIHTPSFVKNKPDFREENESDIIKILDIVFQYDIKEMYQLFESLFIDKLSACNLKQAFEYQKLIKRYKFFEL